VSGAEVRPLRFSGDALELLDQTLLPGEERWIRCAGATEVAEAIRRLAVRGAPAIGLAAAYGAALSARDGGLEDGCRALVEARPTAINLRWAVERVRAAAVEGGPGAALAMARRIESQQVEADRRLGEHGATLFGEAERVLTHCNTGALATGGSGTALGVIRTAHARGGVSEVLVDETRPLLQGARLTAFELDRLGIPYRVVPDSSAGALMARGLVDRVIVGADRIAANGDVANKIGTYTLAVLAERHALPFVVAAPLSTIDPASPSGEAIPIEQRDGSEVTTVAGTEVAPRGATALNPAFDVTPATLVTALVTEAGVLRPPYPRSIADVLAR